MALAPVPSQAEILDLYERGELAPEIARYHEYPGEDDPFLALCIELHNKGDIDLLAVATTDAFAAISQQDFFTAQHIYCEAVPKLKTNAMALMECCRALIKQAGNDGAAGQPNLAFQNWCSANLPQTHQDPKHSTPWPMRHGCMQSNWTKLPLRLSSMRCDRFPGKILAPFASLTMACIVFWAPPGKAWQSTA